MGLIKTFYDWLTEPNPAVKELDRMFEEEYQKMKKEKAANLAIKNIKIGLLKAQGNFSQVDLNMRAFDVDQNKMWLDSAYDSLSDLETAIWGCKVAINSARAYYSEDDEQAV